MDEPKQKMEGSHQRELNPQKRQGTEIGGKES